MDKSFFWRKLAFLLVLSAIVFSGYSCDTGKQKETKTAENQSPNVVVIFLDDAGFADFRPFHPTRYPTPNMDKLADEGCSFYNFYVPQAICSASRAALLTGCYPGRTGVFSALAPKEKGLSTDYATMGEVLQNQGYQTALFGKWHLGDRPGTRPHDRGFDESRGLMYSNDMWADHPEDPDFWGKYPLKYWENGTVKIDSVTADDQKNLTTWDAENAVNFIKENKNNPFFLYVPHSMPHVPLFCSDKFKGKSGTGLYGDVMMEIDWSVGQIMDALKQNGIEENTIVILTSDNGPWHEYGNHAGKTPYREAKATSFDGGVRSPCIIKYPGHIEPNTQSSKTFCSIDLLPTICSLTETQLPDNEIDGKNVWDIITNKPNAENPHEYYAFSNGDDFQGVITSDGKWKLHVPHDFRTLVAAGRDGLPGEYEQEEIGYALYDMIHDPYEKGNVANEYPEITEKLKGFAQKHQSEFYTKNKQ